MDRSKLLWSIAGAAAGALLAWMLTSPPVPPAPAKPMPLVQPQPQPAPQPKPKRPWGPRSASPVGDSEPAVDLLAMPQQLRPRNIASRGLGCCTFRSAEYLARWQEVPQLYGLPEWMKSKGIAGGGYPTKQAEMVRRISEDRQMAVPLFVQYEGRDPAIIELALATGRPVGVTWQANHMLCCVHLDESRAAIVDNNDPHRVQWFSREVFLRKWTQGGGGWAFILLQSPPPPPPRSFRRAIEAPPCGRESCDCGCKDGETCRCATAKSCPCSDQCSCGCNDGRPCDCAEDGGMVWEFTGSERYQLCGVPVSREVVEAALVDDRGKCHLTLIGDEGVRASALAAIGAEAASYHVQSYPADHWAVQCGFVTPGPGGLVVYFQKPGGAVALRRGDVVGLAGALRRADPNYRPQDDPTGDPTLSIDGLRAFAKEHATWLVGGAGGLVTLWLLTRSKGESAAAPAPVPPHPQPIQVPIAAPEEYAARFVAAVESRLAQRQP